MPLKIINLCYYFVLFFASCPMRSRNSSTVADAIFTLVRCSRLSVLIDVVVNECLTARSPQTCQRELQSFALVNPRLSIASALR